MVEKRRTTAVGKRLKKSEALQIIADKVSTCTLCEELSGYRQENNYKTVPGQGNPTARVMFLGEAPGKDEAESGLAFVGRAGQLLTNIIEAAGWTRDDIFICNILKCRPPGNRDPEVEEAKNCRKFLDLQIRCVDPEWIVCLGRIASTHMLGKPPETTMGSMRGVHDVDGRKILCTYHPSYLLRNPAAKKDVWEDLKPLVFALQPAKVT